MQSLLLSAWSFILPVSLLKGEIPTSPNTSGRAARVCDLHYFFDVLDSREESFQLVKRLSPTSATLHESSSCSELVRVVIESRAALDHLFRFTSARLEELKLSFCNIDSSNGYTIRPPPDSSTVVLFDASDGEFGGFSASQVGSVASVCSRSIIWIKVLFFAN